MITGPLVPGRVIERYRVEEVLGEGGTAVVYRVKHLHLGTDHALKVMTMTGSQAGPRLLLEGRVQAALRHPNVVAVTDVLELDGSYGLLMEYVPPPSLSVWIRDRGPQRAEVAEMIFRGIVEGVRHAHAYGLVHRDLKPANVLLARADTGLQPKVADFGLARLLDEDSHRHTRSGLAMGTPQYMAPEQFRDAKTVDRRADLFSLGCILHELLSGQPAFPWSDMIGVYEAMVNGRRDALPASVPPRLIAVIDGCLAPDREQRVPDCGTLLTMLDGSARGPTLVPKAGQWFDAADLAAPPSKISLGSLASPTIAVDGLEPEREAPAAAPRQAALEAPTIVLGPRIEPGSPRMEPGGAPRAPAPSAPSLYPTPPERRWLFPAIGVGVVTLIALFAVVFWPDAPVEPVTPPVASPAPPDVMAAAPAVEPPAAPEAAKPTASNETPKPVVAKVSGATTPAAVKTDTAKADAATAEAARADAARADAARADAARADVARAEAARAEAARAEAARAEAAKAAVVSTDARVRLTGADRAWLEGASGRHSLPGKVPAGKYEIWADFGGGAVGAGEANLSAGDDAEVSCNAGFTTCKVRR
jgi:hypothetical protein